MALYGAFSRHKHLDELDDPIDVGGDIKTPAERAALCLSNLARTAMTAAQLAAVAAVTPGTVTASKAVVVDANGDVDTLGVNVLKSPAATVGTPGALCTAVEHGDGTFHTTVLTLTDFAVGTGDDDVDLAIGAVCYTFPAGAIAILGGAVEGIFSQASAGVSTDGEVGLGTAVAAGATSVLSGTPAFEDVMNGIPYTNITLGTTRFTGAASPTAPVWTVIPAATATRDVYLNLAADWPNIAAAEAVTFTGTVTIRWMLID